MDVIVWFRKGELLRLQGKPAEALAAFEAALKASDGGTLALHAAIGRLRRELAPEPTPATGGPPAAGPTKLPPPRPLTIPPSAPQDAEFAADPKGQWATSAE